MAARSALEIAPVQIEIPARLRKVCFALCAMNLTLCLVAYLLRAWIYDRNGLGIPADFVSFYAAGVSCSKAFRHRPLTGTS